MVQIQAKQHFLIELDDDHDTGVPSEKPGKDNLSYFKILSIFSGDVVVKVTPFHPTESHWPHPTKFTTRRWGSWNGK